MNDNLIDRLRQNNECALAIDIDLLMAEAADEIERLRKELHRIDTGTVIKLRGADLRWANLRGCDLAGADLTGADLSWAEFVGVILTGANLSGVILTGATYSVTTVWPEGFDPDAAGAVLL